MCQQLVVIINKYSNKEKKNKEHKPVKKEVVKSKAVERREVKKESDEATSTDQINERDAKDTVGSERQENFLADDYVKFVVLKDKPEKRQF